MFYSALVMVVRDGAFAHGAKARRVGHSLVKHYRRPELDIGFLFVNA